MKEDRDVHEGPLLSRPPRVALIGIHGHGRVHLSGLLERHRAGRLELCGLADRVPPVPQSQSALPRDAAFDADAARLLDAVRPDVAVIATPIHTHAELARTALDLGAHVLLEKPPVTSLAEHDDLVALAAAARRHCQVGFQAFGSSVIPETLSLIAQGRIGTVERISVVGCWYRDADYYARSAWAGHRKLSGVIVADGALTNPFAHGVALGLRLADPGGARPIRSIRIEPYHAYPIETDDTACARIELDGAAPVTVAVTLCAEREFEPYVLVHGSAGRVTVWYTEDRLLLEPRSAEPVAAAGRRVDLIDDLIAHLGQDPAADVLLSPLRATRPFTAVLEAIQDGPPATPIPEPYQRLSANGRTVPGIEEAVIRCGQSGSLFGELGLAWAASAR